MKTLFFSLFIILSLNVNAASRQSLDVAKLFYSANCDQRCQQGVVIEYYTAKDMFRLPSQVYRNLQRLAFNQAQIWGDTILEGDYVADGKTELDEVMVIKQHGRVVGYAITYSEKAWYVGECTYVYRNPNSLASCDEGRIQERSFVSPNLNEAEVDQNQFADFQSKD